MNYLEVNNTVAIGRAPKLTLADEPTGLDS